MKDVLKKFNREVRAMKHYDRDSIVLKNKSLIRRIIRKANSKSELAKVAEAITACTDGASILSPLSTRPGEWDAGSNSSRTRHVHLTADGRIAKTDAIIFKDNKGNRSHMWKVKVEDGKFISGTMLALGDVLFQTEPIEIDVLVLEFSDIERKKRKKGGTFKSYRIKDKNQLEKVFAHYEKPY